MFDVINFTIVFLIGIFSSSFSVLVGGQSLITIPVLLNLGLAPHVALATNMIGVIGTPLSGLYNFNKKKFINYRIGLLIAVPALLGSIIGANLILSLNESFLTKIISIITIIILIFIMLIPTLGVRKNKIKLKFHHYLIGIIVSFMLGIYGAFYPAGIGTLFTYLLVIVFGSTFLESAGTNKIPILMLTMTAGIIFLFSGLIDYALAIALFLGSVIGSFVGSHYSDKIGNIWIKRMFFCIVIILSLKLLL